MQEALFTIFRMYYPEYQTLITSSQWENTLDNYSNALQSISLLHRRGIESFSNTKSIVAKQFRYRNHAGFQSQARQFAQLLTIEKWEGDYGVLRFHQHPGESHLLHNLTISKVLEESILFRMSRDAGYTTRETEFLLKFLILRGYIQYDPARESYQPATTLDYEKLSKLCQEIQLELDLIGHLFNEEWLVDLNTEIEELIPHILIVQTSKDDEQPTMAKDELQVRFLEIRKRVHEKRIIIGRQVHNKLTAYYEDLHGLIETFTEELPACNTGLELDTHMNGVQRALSMERESTLKKLDASSKSVEILLRQPVTFDDIDLSRLEGIVYSYNKLSNEAQDIIHSGEELKSRSILYLDWITLLWRLHRSQGYLDIAQQITNIDSLALSLDQIIGDIKQDLSTIGIKGLKDIFDTYSAQIDAISKEIDTAVRLATVVADESNNELPSLPLEVRNDELIYYDEQPVSNVPSLLLAIADEAQCITISDLFRQSQMPPELFLHQLVELEQAQKLVTHIYADRQVGINK